MQSAGPFYSLIREVLLQDIRGQRGPDSHLIATLHPAVSLCVFWAVSHHGGGRAVFFFFFKLPSGSEVLSHCGFDFDFDFFLRFYLFIFRERGREEERERINVLVASRVPSTGDLTRNPGMCPDWKSNLQPFGLQVDAQSTEPHQPGLDFDF